MSNLMHAAFLPQFSKLINQLALMLHWLWLVHHHYFKWKIKNLFPLLLFILCSFDDDDNFNVDCWWSDYNLWAGIECCSFQTGNKHNV